MPYLHNDDIRTLCPQTKKPSSNEIIIPINKKPIDKMTTRSQTQYQQLIRSKFGGLLDTKDRNNNNTNFVSEKIGPINCSMNGSTRATTNGNTNNPNMNPNGNGQNLVVRHSSAVVTYQQASSQSMELLEAAKSKTIPLTPRQVFENPTYTTYLTSHERKEIFLFSRIYYIGKRGIKKRTPHTATIYTGPDGFESKVCGFDDNNGSYMPVIHDHIAYRYEVLKIIGKGTFGVVLHAHDHREHKAVAIKVIRNQKRFHDQAKEEIKILTKLLEHDKENTFNIIHMHENFMFRNHPCIVFELLSLNLYELSRKNSFSGFSIPLIRRFTYAIVNCLYALTKFDIIHCDLKPENILLKQNNRSGIKVIDFGSSCFKDRRIHTYIQSRYYRSPEVILNAKYGPPIDMWSLGCILVELFTGRPILDGDDERDQLACMMELLNVPPQQFLYKCKPDKVKLFFDEQGPTYYRFNQNGRSRSNKIRGRPGTRKLLPYCDDTDFKDFIKKCLVWDPAKRLTPIGALAHPWLTKRSKSFALVHQELAHDTNLDCVL